MKRLAVAFSEIAMLLLVVACQHQTSTTDALCALCPPPAPLAGRVLASSCNSGILLVDLGTPLTPKPTKVILSNATTILYQEGGRLACSDISPVHYVYIWPTIRYDLNKPEPIEAAVILIGQAR
jgi:hypothetical protein